MNNPWPAIINIQNYQNKLMEEKEYIEYLLNSGYSITNESNGKMIRDVGEGIEVYDKHYHSFPDRVFKTFAPAYKYFEE